MDLKESSKEEESPQYIPGTYNNFSIIIMASVFGIVILIFSLNYFYSSGDDTKSYVQSTVASKSVSVNKVNPLPSSKPTPTPVPISKLNDKVNVGKFEYNLSKPNIVNQLKSTYSNLKTENQFVTMTIQIKNNDDKPRDVSTSLFKLKDSTGKTYEHIDEHVSVEGNEILFYETINPGLSRTRILVFETPKDLKGFTLECNSGVMLAGGEKALIDLGL